jgi:hypothetical protein
MKSQSDEDVCASHEWQPLFNKPSIPENLREYMSNGYADFMQCSKCDAVGMTDSHTGHKVYLLSESSAQSKRRKALVWNAKQAEVE